ncbi:MAG: Dabb family protein [Bacteroidota bacterium]|nr:Dabb family protein [Bacteroidota bacterium]
MNKVFGTSLAVVALSAIFFLSAALIAKKEQVRHVVVFKFKPSATPEQIAQVTQELGALKSKIPGIVAFEHGVNDSPEKKNLGFTHVYLLTFENAAARDTYLPHPEHKKFGQLLGKLGIMEDVFVVDYAPEVK